MKIPFTPISYIKSEPTTYLIQYKKGKAVRQGKGLSFFYFAPNTTLVSIPTASVDLPFMFAETTEDYQEVTIQGRISYRVIDPECLSTMVNFALDASTKNYSSDDPEKLDNRILNQVQVMVRAEIQQLSLSQTLIAGDALLQRVTERFKESDIIKQLGIEIIDIAIIAIKPTPETTRALEAKMRERVLAEADEAIYIRRNAAVENEREIKENELSTDIAVAKKNQQVKEAEMEAKRVVAEKQREISREDLEASIELENRRKEFVEKQAENAKLEAESKAYAIEKIMQAVSKVDPKLLESIASTNMTPEQLIARSFQGIADNADKIGELNISPDLLGQLLGRA